MFDTLRAKCTCSPLIRTDDTIYVMLLYIFIAFCLLCVCDVSIAFDELQYISLLPAMEIRRNKHPDLRLYDWLALPTAFRTLFYNETYSFWL